MYQNDGCHRNRKRGLKGTAIPEKGSFKLQNNQEARVDGLRQTGSQGSKTNKQKPGGLIKVTGKTKVGGLASIHVILYGSDSVSMSWSWVQGI